MIPSLWISGNLNKLHLELPAAVTQNKKQEVWKIIRDELDLLPYQTSCKFEQNHLIIDKLFDIRLQYLRVLQELKNQDPAFFSKLDYNLASMETEADEEAVFLQATHYSSLNAVYFCLEGLRQDGVNHAIELPLKALQKNKFLTQVQLNEIILPVWLRTNVIRQAQEPMQATIKPPESPFTPYLFRP